MKKLISFICTAALFFTIAGCAEGADPAQSGQSENGSQSRDPVEPPNIEVCKDCGKEPCVCAERPNPNSDVKINTDLLDEFGMTLSELEKKYGRAISGRRNDVDDNGNPMTFVTNTYFFEGNTRGYIFPVEDEASVQGTLSDGTSRVKETDKWGNRIEYREFVGQVKDLFLGFKEAMHIEMFEKTYGIELVYPKMEKYEETSFAASYDDYERRCSVHIIYVQNGIIEPDATIHINYFSEGLF
jgi:hypothetical protein